MIEILGRSGEPEAMNCPALICDACRKQVVDHGNILWGTTVGVEPRATTPLFVAHKGDCDVALSGSLEQQYPGDEWVWLWEEADHFLEYLNNNFKRALPEGPRVTYHDHQVAFPAGSSC